MNRSIGTAQQADGDIALFHSLPCPLAIVAEGGAISAANPALAHWLGLRAASFVGRPLVSLAHPGDQLRLGRALRNRGNPPQHLGTFRLQRADGTFAGAALDVCPSGPPAVGNIAVLFTDRTALQDSERANRELADRLEQLVHDAPAGMFQADVAGRLLYANRRWEDVHGRRLDDCIGMQWADTVHPQDRDRVVGTARELGPGEHFGIRYRLAHGSELWVRARLTGAPRRATDGGLCGVVEDVSGMQRAEQRLVNLALVDPLTGLANRIKFVSALDEQVYKRAGHFAVVGIDLDEFKKINDTHGHAAGDALLQHVATTLQSACRPTDVVARFGGDEFALLLSHRHDAHDVTVSLQRCVAALRVSTAFQGVALYPAASFGVAFFDGRDVGLDGPTLLARADEAMYRAKRRGGPLTVCWWSPAPPDERCGV